MKVAFEKFDWEKHNGDIIATLIYLADPELMSIAFGPKDEGICLLKKLMQMENNQYSTRNITCVQCDQQIVGVLVGFDGKQKREIDKASGQDWAKAFGFWRMLKILPRSLSMQNILTKNVEEDEFYVWGLCVDLLYRGRGIGTKILQMVSNKYEKVCLDVNIYNNQALKFYERNGFVIQDENTIIFKGRKIGNFSMKKGGC